MQRRYQAWFSRMIIRLMGVRIEFVSDIPKVDGGAVLIANHRSMLDIPVIASHFAPHFLSRGDLASWPFLGRLAQHAGTVFVDRTCKRSGASAIRELSRLVSSGKSVIIFPEGTTHIGDEVKAFRAGAFVTAARANVPVVAVGIAYHPPIEWGNASIGKHGRDVIDAKNLRVRVAVGQPRTPLDDVDEEKARFHQEVQDLVELARADALDQG